LSNN